MQALLEVALLREDRLSGLAMLHLGPFVERLDQVLFGGKVVVRIAYRHTSLARYESHRGLVEPTLLKQTQGSFDQQLLRGLASGGCHHLPSPVERVQL